MEEVVGGEREEKEDVMAAAKKCKKDRCIGNVNGECAVEHCNGPIFRTKYAPIPLESAAKIYKIASDSFEDYFGKEGSG